MKILPQADNCEYTVKALQLLPQLQGMSITDALNTLESAKKLLLQYTEFTLDPEVHQLILQEWQNAAQQSS